MGPAVVLGAGLLAGLGAQAQPTSRPARIVTWAAPSRAGVAQAAAAGATGVRADTLADAVLAEAARHGLVVYADLPLDHLTAADLPSRRAAAVQALDALAARARRFPALRYVGLGRRPDTRVPEVCAFLRQLATRAMQAGLRPYVVSAYGAHETCPATPLVFVEVRDEAAFAPLPVVPGAAETGYRLVYRVQPGRRGAGVPGSPERQALALDALLGVPGPVDAGPWHDGAALPADNLERAALGLHERDGRERPAVGVLAAHAAGLEVRRLAFRGSDRRTARGAGETLWFWAALVLGGLVYATEPRLRLLAPRFLRSPSFFRDSVRDARGTLVGATLGQVVALSVVAGVLGALGVRAASGTAGFAVLLGLLPETVGRSVGRLAGWPGALVPFLALVAGLLLGLWAYAFVLAARQRYHLSVWQALLLMVWHHWLLVPVAVTALVVAATPAWRGAWPWLALAALVAVLWGTVRSVVDAVALARLPAWTAAALLAVQPLVVLALLALAWLGPSGIAFLWHLAR